MELFKTADWKRFFTKLYNKIMDTDALGNSAKIAFYFSFSFFPLLFFLVSLFGIVLESTENLRSELYVYLAQIMPGKLLYEIAGVTEEVAREAFTLAAAKLPLSTTIVARQAG